jgi:hypothetical protein
MLVIMFVLGDQLRIIFKIQRKAEASFQLDLLAGKSGGIDI